jgi:gamma-glutamylcyclotransferase (GGCT)/AIG2-like uncharacterized protein YtfP
VNSTILSPWCDFENSLGKFDWLYFYQENDNTDITSESFRTSEVFGLEDDLAEQGEKIVNNIRECFHEWLEEIDVSVAEKIFRFNPDSRFLTFNYTSTLQSVYGIDDKNVFHIHGELYSADELIFGHGDVMEEEPEFDESGDSNRTMFTDAEGAAKYPFHAFRKPVDEVIRKNYRLFNIYNDVNNICVIGHSLNEIDLPYFKKLAEIAIDSDWLVYCYTKESEAHNVQQLLKCGIKMEKIRQCTYSDFNES